MVQSVEVKELNESDWKDNKDSCSEDDDDDDDDDGDSGRGAAAALSFKDLFRMATLGGATGKTITSITRLYIARCVMRTLEIIMSQSDNIN